MQARGESKAHHERLGGKYNDQPNACSESPAKCMGGETITELQPRLFEDEYRMPAPKRSNPARHCCEQQVGKCGNAPAIHAHHYRTKPALTHQSADRFE